MERTFAIIKPDAVRKQYSGQILARIEAAGFTVRAMRMIHMSKAQAWEWARHGIRVNAISPGEIDTSILSPGTEKLVAQIPLRRLGTPEEVAKAIYFLCTDQSSYVNGAEIHINGGQHV